MSGKSVDAIEEFAAEAIIIRKLAPHRVVRALAQRFPEASGLGYAFALTCVAAGLEAERRANPRAPLPDPAPIYRIAALLTADLFEIAADQGHIATGTDLLFHWMQTGDPLFA